jgi:hypothetical protein
MGSIRVDAPAVAAGHRVLVRAPAGRVLATVVLVADGGTLELDDVADVQPGTAVVLHGEPDLGAWTAPGTVVPGAHLTVVLRERPRTAPRRAAAPSAAPRVTATVLRAAGVGSGLAVAGALVELSAHGVAFRPVAPLQPGDRLAVSVRTSTGAAGPPVEATVLRVERRHDGDVVAACRFGVPQHALLDGADELRRPA